MLLKHVYMGLKFQRKLTLSMSFSQKHFFVLVAISTQVASAPLIQYFLFYSLKIYILLHKDLLRTNIFYQYLTDCLLNLIMHLFFLILTFLLLIFCMDDLEYTATLIMFCFIFIYIIIKINHLYLLSSHFLIL